MQYISPITRTITFNSGAELVTDYLAEMGLAIDDDQYLYDQDNGEILRYKDKNIKMSSNGIIAYAGLNDIVYDPFHNYGITNALFGLYLNKCQNSDDGDLLGGYIAHSIEDSPDKGKEAQRVVVKTMRGEIASGYYKLIFLAFADCVFKIGGYNLDLSQFDYKG